MSEQNERREAAKTTLRDLQVVPATELDQALAERDRLAAALRRLHNATNNHSHFDRIAGARKSARAALAAYKALHDR